jgi:hypothetical protein
VRWIQDISEVLLKLFRSIPVAPDMKQNPTSLMQFKTTTPPCLFAIALLFACFWFLPTVRAVSPAPDGGYPGGNTAEGQKALLSLTTGGYNTAVGYLSLGLLTTGSANTGLGAGALLANTGEENTATGAGALLSNTTGFQNTANGAFALSLNTTGAFNTAIGDRALPMNTTGVGNTANGDFALQFNTEGSNNTGIGFDALQDNLTGTSNTAIGDTAGLNITGDGNVCIGADVGGAAEVNDTTWIRNVYASVASGRAVYVNADNKLGTLSSSRRYKDEIRPVAKASEAILSLRPVSFRYKKEVDPTRSLSFGLIAEEVAEIDPDLVTSDRDGKPQTVRYEAVNAMLLNEFLKQHKKVQEQGATVTELKRTLAQQHKESQSIATQQQKEIQALAVIVKKQASQLQRVSAQLELQKHGPRSVLNQTANADL